MSNIFKAIKYYFLSLREKHLQDKLKSTTQRSFLNSKTKHIMGNGAELTFSSETLKLIESVKTGVSDIVKKTNCDANELLNYVKAAKTKVYYVNNADKLLNLVKEEEGLIYEKRGFEALYLSLITGQGIKFETKPMFIMRKGNIDKYYMLHNFYRWFSLKSGLGGFDYLTQQNLKKILFEDAEYIMKRLSMKDILSLKEAITRDNEATNFVLEYTKSIDGGKNVINKIKNDGGANI